MPHRPDAPLQLDLRPSRQLGVFLLVAHSATLAVIPLLILPEWLAVGIAIGIAGSLATALRDHAMLLSAKSVVRLVWDTAGEWTLATAGGQVMKGTLEPGSFVTPLLVTLRFRLAGAPWYLRYHSVVLVADGVDPTAFRRLRVRLLAS